MTDCPEALYGQHGDPNTEGRCPYCGYRLSGRRAGTYTDGWYERGLRRRQYRIAYEQDPLNIEPDEGSYYEEEP